VVTSLARTVLDLARTLPYAEAVATGDAALRLGLERAVLEDALGRASRRPGIGAARRVVLHRLGLAPSTLQLEVRDDAGALVGRCDFGWEEHSTVGEFDGRVKYGRLLRPDQRIEDVVWAEKQREDAIRDLGRQMVRWTWGDLQRERILDDRLRRAFHRGKR
jgi:hypothetical protein